MLSLEKKRACWEWVVLAAPTVPRWTGKKRPYAQSPCLLLRYSAMSESNPDEPAFKREWGSLGMWSWGVKVTPVRMTETITNSCQGAKRKQSCHTLTCNPRGNVVWPSYQDVTGTGHWYAAWCPCAMCLNTETGARPIWRYHKGNCGVEKCGYKLARKSLTALKVTFRDKYWFS